MLEHMLAVRYAKTGAQEAVLLSFQFKQDDGKWLAECLELGTATYAATLEEAQKEIVDAVSLHLNQVEEMGFTADFLREHGVQWFRLDAPRGGPPEAGMWSFPVATAR
ncbi:MAG: hypothetical protein HYY01_11620 [Chloroflexi bacterium]|nr:hypothetical protein [Chloroflexota bacterium]